MPSPITKRVSKAGKASWTVQVAVGVKADGKTRWHTATFDREGKAKAYLKKLEQDRERGTVPEPHKLTLDAFLDRWLKDAARLEVRANTLESYERLLKLYVRPTLGERLLSTLTPAAVQGLYSDMDARGLSPRTVRLTHSILARAMRQAVTWNLIATTPTARPTLPRKRQREMRALTEAEVGAFLTAAASDRFATFFEVSLVSGMRPSELLGLRWVDVDFDRGTVKVQRTLLRTKDTWELAETKTERSRRTIPLPARTIDALRSHRARQGEERLKLGEAWQDNGLVFPDRTGEPLDRHNLLSRHFKPILKRASLPASIRLYDLRHTCATLLLTAGVHAKVVSERLGHASIVQTLDVYSHVLPHMQVDATAKLAALLPGGPF